MPRIHSGLQNHYEGISELDKFWIGIVYVIGDFIAWCQEYRPKSCEKFGEKVLEKQLILDGYWKLIEVALELVVICDNSFVILPIILKVGLYIPHEFCF
jgi:hypothetical protein